jgi:hypothetical protein
MSWRVFAFLETPEASVVQTDTECDRPSVPVVLMFFLKLTEFLNTLDRSVHLEAHVTSFDEQADRTSDTFPTGRVQAESKQIS